MRKRSSASARLSEVTTKQNWPRRGLRPHDKAQHSAGDSRLASIRLGDLAGIGMVVIDGVVRGQRCRNTPPAEKIPSIVKAPAPAASGGH